MANATPRDGHASSDLYRAAGGSISLDDLNEQLIKASFGPVAQRHFTHHRHLIEAGYNRYISIDRFGPSGGHHWTVGLMGLIPGRERLPCSSRR